MHERYFQQNKGESEMNNSVIGLDIAKNVFQCVLFKNDRQIGKNKTYKRQAFIDLLTTHQPANVVMEACSGAQHWARLAKAHGHEVILLPPRMVVAYRHGQKTDANDALAIYEASKRPKLKASPHKTLDQQALATLESVRAHYQSRKNRLGNALRGHLAEFGIVLAKGYASLRRHMPLILEDAENGLPMAARAALNIYWQDWQQAHQQVKTLEKEILQMLRSMPSARELMKVEGIGPVSATGLICTLGDARVFQRGKEAAAFIGTAPKQHSSGGKEVIIGISKTTGHKKLRANLIQGARSVLIKLRAQDKPPGEKARWFLQLAERQGDNRAVVAFANKNVRTAWALLAYNRTYLPA
jgi:transposase